MRILFVNVNNLSWGDKVKLVFCGGAGEVGASCYLLCIDGKKILLDCGTRMKGGKDSLPDLRRIQELGGVDAIIISHAHMDHTGSLPIVSKEYPEAKIYMTHATKDLIRVLLYDSLKIMNNAEGEIPIYAEKHVQEMLSRIICYSPQYTFEPIKDSDIKITFYNAGHIAGAALIYIQGKEGTLLYTGDVSGVEQQTVNAATVPKLRPDVLIMESTYGDKLHSNRQVEEERLIEIVKENILNKGKILIPAFALGRAQEIILLLKKAINKGKLPKFKIYVDGMVKDINRMYKLNPNYLKRNLAKKIFKGNDIFYDDNIIPVSNNEIRDEIVNLDEGLCVVSSSGMLKGGPSTFYAEKFASDERNYIAITGYQDEEAPGKEILDLLDTDEKDRYININDKNIPLKCGIGKYGLSAHGDKVELMGIINRTTPRKIFLVHGDKDVISIFANEVNRDARAQVYVPSNGEEYDIRFKNPRKQLFTMKKIKPLYKRVQITEKDMLELWQYLYKLTGVNVGYSVEDIIYIWSGQSNFSEEKVIEYRKILNNTKYFTPNSRRLFLYHPVKEEELIQEESTEMEMNDMLAFVNDIFPKEAGLYKTGARYEDKIVLLYFNFPDKAKETYKDEIQKIERETGWKVEINDDCNQGAAEELIYSLLPRGVMIDKLSYYRNKGYFSIDLSKDIDIDGISRIQEEFERKSGMKLVINSNGQLKTEELSLKIKDKGEMMEQNKAFNIIESVFLGKRHKLFKKSKKVLNNIPYIELSFVSPQIGYLYKDAIEQLEKETGWNITINQNPNQNEIIKTVKMLFREKGIPIKKNPSVYINEAMVKVSVDEELDDELRHQIEEELKMETGYGINVEQ